MKKVELLVPPANANEVQATKILTSDEHAYLKWLWEKFHNRIQKLDKNNTPSDISGDEENNKRDQSVSFTDKDYDKELDPF